MRSFLFLVHLFLNEDKAHYLCWYDSINDVNSCQSYPYTDKANTYWIGWFLAVLTHINPFSCRTNLNIFWVTGVGNREFTIRILVSNRERHLLSKTWNDQVNHYFFIIWSAYYTVDMIRWTWYCFAPIKGRNISSNITVSSCSAMKVYIVLAALAVAGKSERDARVN